MAKFLTDEEMTALEVKQQPPGKPKFISDDDMVKLEAEQKQPAPEKTGLSAIPSDINARGDEIVNIWNKPQNPLSKAWQTVGQVGKTATGVVGRTLETAKPLTDAIMEGAAVSGGYRGNSKWGDVVPSVANEVAKTDFAKETGKTIKIFKEDNPELAGNLGAGLNILGGVALKGAPKGKILDFAREAKALPETINKTTSSVGNKIQDVAKIAGSKGWKLKGSPDDVAAKRNVAAENDIWGNARKASEQVDVPITEKYKALKTKIEEHSDNPAIKVYPKQLIEDARIDALKNVHPDKEAAVNSSFDKLLARTEKLFGDKPVDLADAQMYKQQIGEWGHDVFDVTKKGMPVTAQSGEHQAYLKAYDKFKTEIEDIGPPGVKEANKELSTLLALRKDLRSRVAVEERNKFMPLDEVITAAHAAASVGSGNFLPAALYGGQVAMRSPGIAKGAYNIGEVLKGFAKRKEISSDGTKLLWETGEPITGDKPAIPTYFRKGINPEKANEDAISATFKAATEKQLQKQKAYDELKAGLDALRPKRTTQQDAIDAMKRHQLGLPPDAPMANVEIDKTPLALRKVSNQLGSEFKGREEFGDNTLYNFTEKKTGGDFYTKKPTIAEIVASINKTRERLKGEKAHGKNKLRL